MSARLLVTRQLKNKMHYDMILQVGDVLVSPDVITEYFCCDLEACDGACCVEGESGAPVTLDEVAVIEDALPALWPQMSASAQAEVDRRGVAYADTEGDLVTSIVGGRDCVFTCYEGNTCLCLLERLWRSGKTGTMLKPLSCSLYPIRERRLSNGLVALNYHRWSICESARIKGRALGLRVYQFLREPLIRRFGSEWYDELCLMADKILEKQRSDKTGE